MIMPMTTMKKVLVKVRKKRKKTFMFKPKIMPLLFNQN